MIELLEIVAWVMYVFSFFTVLIFYIEPKLNSSNTINLDVRDLVYWLIPLANFIFTIYILVKILKYGKD